MLRITMQLTDTLVIIHGTHTYFRESEQWFSYVGSEKLEVLTCAKAMIPCISVSSETTGTAWTADVSVSLGRNLTQTNICDVV